MTNVSQSNWRRVLEFSPLSFWTACAAFGGGVCVGSLMLADLIFGG